MSHLTTAWPHSISHRRAVVLLGQGDTARLSSLRGPLSSKVSWYFEDLKVSDPLPCEAEERQVKISAHCKHKHVQAIRHHHPSQVLHKELLCWGNLLLMICFYTCM